MKKIMKISLVTAITIASLGTSASANTNDSIQFMDGKLTLSGDANLRYESVDIDKTKTVGTSDNEASAITARVKLNAAYKYNDNLSTEIEGIGVRSLKDDYSPENSNFAKVSDPENNRIQKLNFTYIQDNLTAKAGRFEVQLDNGRVIGDKKWRQMHQSFDAALVSYNYQNITFTGAITANVLPAGVSNSDTVESSSVLLHTKYKHSDKLSVSVFDYMIDDSFDNLGLIVKGNGKLNNKSFSYELEYDKQSDSTIGDSIADGELMAFNLSFKPMEDMKIITGYEDHNNFNISLGNTHKFFGLTDAIHDEKEKSDLYLKLSHKSNIGKFVIDYHSYSNGSDDLGSEYGLAFSKKIQKNISSYVGYGSYNAGDDNLVANKDVNKLYAQIKYSF